MGQYVQADVYKNLLWELNALRKQALRFNEHLASVSPYFESNGRFETMSDDIEKIVYSLIDANAHQSQ